MIKREVGAFLNYLKTSWVNLLLSLATAMFVFWMLSFFHQTIEGWIEKIERFLPALFFVLIFEWLVFIGIWRKAVSIWLRYRNSYFLKQPSFSIIDVLLLSIVSLLYWLIFETRFWESAYFISLLISLGVFGFLTYAMALASFLKTQILKDHNASGVNGQTSLFSDEPINNDVEDLIGRKKFASSLKEHIYKLSFRESFVMALYGRWGEGKTSILNLIKKEMKAEKQLLIYEFDPWFFAEENALTANFYRGLEDLLQEHYFIPSGTKNSLKFYPEVLIKGFVSVSFRLHKDNEDRPLELKGRIEKFIDSLDRRVLVVIDDLDRLQGNEILAIFRLIKLTSHMKNMVFLLSFDPVRVISIIKRNGTIDDPENYIEKIVQLPIHLPLTDQRKIDQFLLFSYPDIGYVSEIDKFFDQLGITGIRRKEFDEVFVKIYQSDLKQIFSTYRAAKRYLNSIFFRLPFIEREVHLYDFFILEVFQTFFPSIYADMKLHPWYYVSPWSLEIQAYSPLPYDKGEKYKAIKGHIEKLLSEKEREITISLLEDIFPEIKNAFGRGNIDYGGWAEDYRKKKRIAHPDCFLKYFMLGVREGVISDAEFEDELQKWIASSTPEEEIRASFFDKYQKDFKLIDFLQRLKLYAGLLDGKLIFPLIRVIYKSCSRFRQDGDLWNTEYDQADGLIFRLLEDNPNIQDNEMQEILKEIIEKTERYDFASMIVLTCNPDRSSSLQRIYKNVKPEELREILKKRLRAYFVENKKDIFVEYREEREFAFILYQWATHWGDRSKPRNDEVTGYLVEIFKKNPKNAGFFLRHFAKKSLGFREEKRYFDYNEFKFAYDPIKFSACLTELGEQAYSTESEREAVELLLKAYSDEVGKNLPSDQQSQNLSNGKVSS